MLSPLESSEGTLVTAAIRQLDAFEALVKSINDFWLTKVKLPQQRQNG
jgi:hypothetical protein